MSPTHLPTDVGPPEPGDGAKADWHGITDKEIEASLEVVALTGPSEDAEVVTCWGSERREVVRHGFGHPALDSLRREFEDSASLEWPPGTPPGGRADHVVLIAGGNTRARAREERLALRVRAVVSVATVALSVGWLAWHW